MPSLEPKQCPHCGKITPKVQNGDGETYKCNHCHYTVDENYKKVE